MVLLLLLVGIAGAKELIIFFWRKLTSCTQSAEKKPDWFDPRIYPSRRPQSVDPTTSIISPVFNEIWPVVFPEYGSMQTTVVLGCPIEHAAESELVPTPDESLMISLVSPIDLSKYA